MQPTRREHNRSDALCHVSTHSNILSNQDIKKKVYYLFRNSETAAKIRQYYNEKKIVKQYLAITKDIPKPSEGEINIPLIRRSINGKYKVQHFYYSNCLFFKLLIFINIFYQTYLSPDYNEIKDLMSAPPTKDNEKRRYAVTKYRVLDSYGKAALVEVQPQTGNSKNPEIIKSS